MRDPLKRARVAAIVRFLAAAAVLFAAATAFGMGAAEEKPRLAFTNARVIDGTGRAPIERGTVLVAGSRIAGVGRTGVLSVPQGYRVYDLAGRSLLPGFINAHVHAAYDEQNLNRWLRAGVTSVRDLGPFLREGYVAARDRLNRDPCNARIIAASPLITAPGGYGSLPVSSAEDASRLAVSLIDQGVDLVKIALEDDLQGRQWTLLPAQIAKAIVASAHNRGVRVSAHISHARNLDAALCAGVDDLAHMVVEPLSDSQIRSVVERGTFWVPTLELWKGVSEIHGLDWDRVAIENLRRFSRAGGKVALGTDFSGYVCPFDRGFPVTEVSLMAKAGMSPMDIIVAGTKNAAIVSGKAQELGTIETGKQADLLVVEGDPLRDLGALSRTGFVVHGGVVVRAPEDAGSLAN